MQSISIHALREESDTVRMGKKQRRKNFNPRPPRGERRTAFSTNSSSRLFQSTPSARRATQAIMQGVYNHIISIHALREEGDALWACFRCAACLFQSTPSARRATANTTTRSITGKYFNPRPPRGERRRILQHGASLENISIHALREESDQQIAGRNRREDYFNPRPPRGERLVSECSDYY